MTEREKEIKAERDSRRGETSRRQSGRGRGGQHVSNGKQFVLLLSLICTLARWNLFADYRRFLQHSQNNNILFFDSHRHGELQRKREMGMWKKERGLPDQALLILVVAVFVPALVALCV